MAQNVIVPIIDLTASAAGSTVPQNLQTAWGFETQHNTINNQTTTLIINSGFWQVNLNYIDENVLNTSTAALGRLFLDDGTSEKTIWQVSAVNTATGNESRGFSNGKFVVYLRAGDSLKGFSSSTRSSLDVWYRQIADVNGVLVNPVGFNPQ